GLEENPVRDFTEKESLSLRTLLGSKLVEIVNLSFRVIGKANDLALPMGFEARSVFFLKRTR
ncbi:MAG: hypothetical protein LBU10_05195, partial [Endomicrobium sp.]|nr:hypothetical protein [Endomicrobium sp.]